MPRVLQRAYGLLISSNRAIPTLASIQASEPPDLELTIGQDLLDLDPRLAQGRSTVFVSQHLDERKVPALKIDELEGGDLVHLRYADGTEFVINRAATKLWTWWPPESTVDDMATYLLGPVFGHVLRMRGSTSLHASAVSIGGRAVAFMGPPGAGKSTTGAAFARRGYAVLSDDVLPLRGEGDTCWAHPGLPVIRLWPDSVGSLFGSPDALPRLTPTWDKRYLDLAAGGYRFQESPLPLGAVYALGETRAGLSGFVVERASGSIAALSLIGNAYRNKLASWGDLEREFQLLCGIAGLVPVRKLVGPEGNYDWDALCDAVLSDLGSAPTREST